MAAQGEERLSLLGKPGSIRKVITVSLGIGLATLCWGSFPAFSDRGHVVADIEHGGAVMSALGVTLFLLILSLGLRRISLCKTAGGSPWVIFWGMLGSLFILGMLAIIFFFGRDYKLAADLGARGTPTQARLVRQFTSGCGKRGCSTGLEYNFIPAGQTTPVRGFVDIGHKRGDPVYDYAVSTGTLPILYDPADPSRSLVNWGDQIQRRGSLSVTLQLAALFFGLLLFVLALLAPLLSSVPRAVAASQAGDS